MVSFNLSSAFTLISFFFPTKNFRRIAHTGTEITYLKKCKRKNPPEKYHRKNISLKKIIAKKSVQCDWDQTKPPNIKPEKNRSA